MKYDYDDIYLVGIGSSAGGIEALKGLLSTLPTDKPVAYIIAQHLNPQYKSMLTDILSRETKMEVTEIYNGLAIEPSRVYVTPANANVSVRGGIFYTTIPEQTVGPKPSIDILFNSLTQEKGEKAIGVILSGTGSDGTAGLRAIKSGGGVTIAQEPKSAKYDGMPASAIESKVVDKVLLPEEMGLFLSQIVSEQGKGYGDYAFSHDTLDAIFNVLNLAFDIDFSAYKPSTIMRRIEKRMASVKARTLDEYLEYLKSNPSESSFLYNDILIGVTSFYRDSEAFEALSNALRGYLENHSYPDIRVWSAGCATGEEAYTLAMILSEICESLDKRVDIQVFATDMDESSLSVARSGIYPEIISAAVPSSYLEKYFRKKGNIYEITRPIREKVIFSKHNLLRDPPFLRLDLICCRNLLIYLEPEIQQKTILSFHHSLRAGGILFLGKSEALGKTALYFSTISSKFKIFKARVDIRPQISEMIPPGFKRGTLAKREVERKKDGSLEEEIAKTLFESFVEKCVVVDEDGNLMYTKGELDGIASLPKGSMNLNFSKMINSELSVDFRSLLFKAAKNKTEQRLKPRIIKDGDKTRKITLSIFPLGAHPNKYLVVFDEFGAELTTNNEMQHLNDERYKQLQEELDSTKEHLQTVVQELETSNEELQATNEELQSSNEELQATNEELETSNEELQSSNEELQTAYIELKMIYEEQAKQRGMLEEANKELLRLNNELNAKEHYISALLDAEQAIVIVTRRGEELLDANNGFFNFFSEYSSLEEFKAKHKCICELFEEVDGDDTFLRPTPKEKDGKNWLDVVLASGPKNKKALMKKDGKPYIFSVHANDLDIINQKYVVVFSNITDIEAEKMVKEEEVQKELKKVHQKERVQIMRALQSASSEYLILLSSGWRETIAAIINLASELQEDAEYGPLGIERIREFGNKTHQQLKNLVDSVERSREFFQTSRTKEYFDIIKIVNDILEVFAKEFKNKNIQIVFEHQEQKVEYYGLIDEVEFLVYNMILLYKRFFSLSNNQCLTIGVWQEHTETYINFSSPDKELLLQRYLLQLLSQSGSDDAVGLDIEQTRAKMIESLIEDELNGTLQLQNDGEYTNLKISMRVKHYA